MIAIHRSTSSSRWLWTYAAGAALAFVACGGEQTPAATPGDPTSALPFTTPTGTAAALPAPDPSAMASATPAGSAAADAGAPPAKSSGGGRPPVLKTDDTSITDTFGTAPAKLEIGDDKGRATLKIPEGALDKGYNITFQLDPKAKSGGAQLGKLYRIKTQIAGAQDFVKVSSTGDAFELAMPAGGKKDANLAIGESTTDEKGKDKIKWTIIAPKRIDDVANMAFFDLPTLGGDTVIHITTKPPAAASDKPAK